jgi:hypothetical protein
MTASQALPGDGDAPLAVTGDFKVVRVTKLPWQMSRAFGDMDSTP